MNRAPAFQFYAKDWLDFRVQRMSLAAQGAYLKLLCFMWNDSKDQCSIIDCNELLARAIGITSEQWLELRKEIQWASDPILEEKNGVLISRRLNHEAANQRKHRKMQSEKGRKSAEQRANRGSTVVQPQGQPEANSSSSSSSSYSELREEKRAVPLSAKTADRPPRCLQLPDQEFLTELRANPAYRDIDIDYELAKLDAWLLTPKGRGKHKTRLRIVYWLNKAADDQREINTPASGPQRTCIWKLTNGDGRHSKLCGKPVCRVDGLESSHCDEHLPKHLEQRRHVDAQIARRPG
jgi:uncharacterized protein YdaU (DUF1376 family)